MAWLYWRTNCSLLLVMLLHAAVNNTKDIVPSASPGATNVFALSASRIGWLTVLLLWIGAAYFLFAMRSSFRQQQNQSQRNAEKQSNAEKNNSISSRRPS
jgi:hypothetical protein